MQYVKADTVVKVVIGPFVDVGDGFTPETGVTLTGGGDNADAAELLKHDNATTVDLASNTWAALTGVDGYYHLTLTAANTDTEGHLSVIIQNDSVHLPVRNDFMVVNANVYDALFAAAGTDLLQTDVTEWRGSTPAVLADTDKVSTSTQHMAANIITSSILATDAIGAAQVAANAITSSELADGAITAAKFAAGAIDATAIAANAITATAIATGAMTNAKFAAGAIDAAAIAADAITAAKIATGAMTNAKFAAGAIDAAAIAADAITAAKIAADAIGASELATAAATKIRDTILSDSTAFAGANINATISSRATPTQVATELATYDSPTYTELLNFIRVVTRSDAAIATDLAAVLVAINADLASGPGDYANTIEALEAIRDTAPLGTAMRGTENAALATALATAQADLDIITGADGVNLLSATQTTVDAIDTNTQNIQSRIPAALVGGRIDAAVDGTGMEVGAIDALLQRQMTESYNADGAAPTVEQALMGIFQCLTEFAISGTTITVKKLDGSTAAMTFTLDDATDPTSRTRAT